MPLTSLTIALQLLNQPLTALVPAIALSSIILLYTLQVLIHCTTKVLVLLNYINSLPINIKLLQYLRYPFPSDMHHPTLLIIDLDRPLLTPFLQHIYVYDVTTWRKQSYSSSGIVVIQFYVPFSCTQSKSCCWKLFTY